MLIFFNSFIFTMLSSISVYSSICFFGVVFRAWPEFVQSRKRYSCDRSDDVMLDYIHVRRKIRWEPLNHCHSNWMSNVSTFLLC